MHGPRSQVLAKSQSILAKTELLIIPILETNILTFFFINSIKHILWNLIRIAFKGNFNEIPQYMLWRKKHFIVPKCCIWNPDKCCKTEKKLEEAIITYRYYGCVNISKNFYDDFNKLAVDRWFFIFLSYYKTEILQHETD